MNAGIVADVLAGIFTVAIIYVLVRPRSAAADMVNLFGNAVAALARAATDL